MSRRVVKPGATARIALAAALEEQEEDDETHEPAEPEEEPPIEQEEDDETHEPAKPEEDPQETADDQDDGTMCPVCHDVIRNARIPVCGHALCLACLNTMEEKANGEPMKCPMCNAPVSPFEYKGCHAFDKAIEKLHPRVDAPAEEKKANIEVDSAETLKSWAVAAKNEYISRAVKLIWTGVKACLIDSTAIWMREQKMEPFVNDDDVKAWIAIFAFPEEIAERVPDLSLSWHVQDGEKCVLVQIPNPLVSYK
ncbi:MAG: hypothetical protein KGL39_30120 [Patescibacteria group bacterium]|nr:hypothetical protein [Patescibacteria group bacterium]